MIQIVSCTVFQLLPGRICYTYRGVLFSTEAAKVSGTPVSHSTAPRQKVPLPAIPTPAHLSPTATPQAHPPYLSSFPVFLSWRCSQSRRHRRPIHISFMPHPLHFSSLLRVSGLFFYPKVTAIFVWRAFLEFSSGQESDLQLPQPHASQRSLQ